jgi:hypothetical protein
MPHWRSRWRVRSGLGQRPPPPGPEGRDLRSGAAHVARPPDGRLAEQGRARRVGAAAPGRLGARRQRSGGEGSGPGGAGADRPGLRQLPGAGLGGQSAPLLPGARAHCAAARPVRRGNLADANRRHDLGCPEKSGVRRRLRLRPDPLLPRHLRQRQANHRPLSDGGVEDCREGPVSCLCRVGRLRADPGHAARQPRGVYAQSDARRAARGCGAAAGQPLVRPVRPQDDRGIQEWHPLRL